MNKTAGIVVGFIFGAAFGGAASWYATKQFYEKRTQEEIDSVKQTYAQLTKKKLPRNNDPDAKATVDSHTNVVTKADIDEYVRRIQNEDYSSYSRPMTNLGTHSTQEEKDAEDAALPFIISEDEFGVIDEYETKSLRYYDDGTLAFENGMIIPAEEIKEYIGYAISEIGADGLDAVYVRNDKHQTYYEVDYIPDPPDDGEED